MDEVDFEPDKPTSKPVDSATQGGDNTSDVDEDDMPDFGSLAAALATRGKGKAGIEDASEAGTSSMPSIPKRGEKDFEPTGFVAQERRLEQSRSAMFDVIQHQRVVNFKSIAVATWEPTLSRAIVHFARGQAFSAMGVSNRVAVLKDGQFEDLAKAYAGDNSSIAEIDGAIKQDGKFWPKLQSRLELLPEEALYLVERGVLECRMIDKRRQKSATLEEISAKEYNEGGMIDDQWIPMTVEQAYSTMLNVDGLTRSRYQLYAHMKRLGYIVQRKRISDELRRQSATAKRSDSVQAEGVLADPHHPLKLVTIFDVLLYPLRRVRQIVRGVLARFWEAIGRVTAGIAAQRVKASSLNRGGLLGISGTSWQSYNDVLDRLRFIKGEHSGPVRRSTGMTAPEIFFYAWRPASVFKRSDPPLPEFQIAVVDARESSLPDARAFAELFDQSVLPMNVNIDQMTAEEHFAWQALQEQKKRNDESYGRGAVKKQQREANAAKKGSQKTHHQASSSYTFLSRWKRIVTLLITLFAHLPPGCAVRGPRRMGKKGGGGGGHAGPNGGNIYGPLKSGRRNIIVAVNDCATTSLIRFGEAEFSRWRIQGGRG